MAAFSLKNAFEALNTASLWKRTQLETYHVVKQCAPHLALLVHAVSGTLVPVKAIKKGVSGHGSRILNGPGVENRGVGW